MGVLLSKIKESLIQAGKRILKVNSIGGAMTAKESMPFGIDAVALQNMTAVYATTSNISERVVIGYINKNQIAGEGESRLYSLDADGNLKAYIWNKADGKLLLNGEMYSAVRFENLDSGMQAAATNINFELTKISEAISSLGGSYVIQPLQINIDSAESPYVKLK